MKIPKLPEYIKVHSEVIRTINEIAITDDEMAFKLLQRIVELADDPVPDNEECNSKTVFNLQRQKLSINRLKCLDITGYRLFYSYRKSGMVCIYYLIERNKDTYNKDSFHYKFIKLLYKQWGECQ